MAKLSFETRLRDVILMREWVRDFEEYPFSIPAIHTLSRLAMHPKVTFFVGENGTGKSTLLEAIAVAHGLNAEGGSRNFRFETRASHSKLHRFLRLSEGVGPQRRRDGFFFRAESLFNLATEIERLDREPGGRPLIEAYGGQPLHEQSHGEAFLALLKNRFGDNGLYLLDEPESALSPTRQMAMITVMHDLIGRGSQFIIATHSPIIMAYPDATIYAFSDDGIAPTTYTETEHYAVTRAFLTRTEKMLEELCADDA